MIAYLIVGFGAFIGGAMRHGVNQFALRLFGGAWPIGTFTVNVAGSLLMGLLAGYFAFKGGASQHARLFLTTGILGGFTTFSAYSLEVALLIERGQMAAAIGYSGASVFASVGALFTGLWIVRWLSA